MEYGNIRFTHGCTTDVIKRGDKIQSKRGEYRVVWIIDKTKIEVRTWMWYDEVLVFVWRLLFGYKTGEFTDGSS